LGGLTGGQSGASLLGQLAPYGVAAGVGLLQAKGAQNQTNSEVGAITAASAPYLNASQSFLKQFENQQLTPSQQQYVDWTSTEAQDLINSGQAAQTIAQTNFADYQAGTLKPADQLALDQQTQAQKQQITSMLASQGIQDSSVAAAYTQQIDNQAAVTKQNVLNSYFATGDQAYNTWLNSTAEGIQVKTLGAQFAQTAFQEMLQASLGFGQIGMQGLETAIGLQIQSDTALSQQVGNLMQNLMAAYALQNGLSSGSGTLGNAKTLLSSLLGGSAPASVANFNNAFAASGAGAAASTASSDVASEFNSATASQMGSYTAPLPSGSVSVGAPGDYGAAEGAQVASDVQSTNNAAVDAYSASAGDAGTAGDAAGGASALGIAGGALGAAGGIYDLSQNWQSGATGSDIRGGAETGAGIGTAILPGVGTAIGAVGGAAVGAISSLFGPGKKDPETQTWDNYAGTFASKGAQGVSGATPAQNYQMLAGIFDARSSNIPFYQKFGRMGEGAFMQSMTSQINQAVTSGKVPKNATAQEIYQKVVEPWINSMSPGGWQNTSTSKGAPEKQAIGNLLTNIIQQYQQGMGGKFTGIAGQGSPITAAYGS
jgi:hypothetical protein